MGASSSSAPVPCGEGEEYNGSGFANRVDLRAAISLWEFSPISGTCKTLVHREKIAHSRYWLQGEVECPRIDGIFTVSIRSTFYSSKHTNSGDQYKSSILRLRSKAGGPTTGKFRRKKSDYNRFYMIAKRNIWEGNLGRKEEIVNRLWGGCSLHNFSTNFCNFEKQDGPATPRIISLASFLILLVKFSIHSKAVWDLCSSSSYNKPSLNKFCITYL